MAYAQCDFLDGGKMTPIDQLADPLSLPDNIVQLEVPDDTDLDLMWLDIGKLRFNSDTHEVDEATVKLTRHSTFASIRMPMPGDTTLPILGTLNKKYTGDDLIAETRMGRIQVEVPHNADGASHQIDVATMKAVPIVRSAPPPDFFVQLAAAQIKAGMISADDFHPDTLAAMDDVLTTAGMAIIKAK